MKKKTKKANEENTSKENNNSAIHQIKKHNIRALFGYIVTALSCIWTIVIILKYDDEIFSISFFTEHLIAGANLIVSFVSASIMFAADHINARNKYKIDSFDYAYKKYKKIYEDIDTEDEEVSEDTKPKENNTPKENDTTEKNVSPLDELKKPNQQLIIEYYAWNKSQAKLAFILAVVLSLLGFVIIGYAVFMERDALSIIGGVVTEFLAGTALVIYRSSVKQLDSYFETLHENERLFMAMTIIEKVSSKKSQDQLYAMAVQNELKLNFTGIPATDSDAQDEEKTDAS